MNKPVFHSCTTYSTLTISGSIFCIVFIILFLNFKIVKKGTKNVFKFVEFSFYSFVTLQVRNVSKSTIKKNERKLSILCSLTFFDIFILSLKHKRFPSKPLYDSTLRQSGLRWHLTVHICKLFWKKCYIYITSFAPYCVCFHNELFTQKDGLSWRAVKNGKKFPRKNINFLTNVCCSSVLGAISCFCSQGSLNLWTFLKQ